MTFAIKAEVCDPRAKTFAFTAQKTMYGGKHIAEGDTVFVFASENEANPGPSSISSSIVRPRTRSPASRMKRRRSSANSSRLVKLDCAGFDGFGKGPTDRTRRDDGVVPLICPTCQMVS